MTDGGKQAKDSDSVEKEKTKNGCAPLEGNSEAHLGHAGLAQVLIVYHKPAVRKWGGQVPRVAGVVMVHPFWNAGMPPGRTCQVPLKASSVPLPTPASHLRISPTRLSRGAAEVNRQSVV